MGQPYEWEARAIRQSGIASKEGVRRCKSKVHGSVAEDRDGISDYTSRNGPDDHVFFKQGADRTTSAGDERPP